MRKFFKWLAAAVTWLCAVVLLLLSLAGFVPQPQWYVDNVAQLRIPLLIAVAALLFIALPMRRKQLTKLLLAMLLIDALPIATMYLPGPAVPSQQESRGVKVIASNVWGARNPDQKPFEHMIHDEQPDIFILIELTPQWINALKRDLPEYSIQFQENISGGTAIFSKIPIQQQDMRGVSPRQRRFGVCGTINVDGQDVLLIGSHPPAPQALKRWQSRNAELLRLSEDVRRESAIHPVVIAGDLNTTPWSFYFQRLIEAGLHDSEQGVGPQPSWSRRMPLPMVPIDHALYTDGIAIRNRRLGPDIGSDHLPVIFEIVNKK